MYPHYFTIANNAQHMRDVYEAETLFLIFTAFTVICSLGIIATYYLRRGMIKKNTIARYTRDGVDFDEDAYNQHTSTMVSTLSTLLVAVCIPSLLVVLYTANNAYKTADEVFAALHGSIDEYLTHTYAMDTNDMCTSDNVDVKRVDAPLNTTTLDINDTILCGGTTPAIYAVTHESHTTLYTLTVTYDDTSIVITDTNSKDTL